MEIKMKKKRTFDDHMRSAKERIDKAAKEKLQQKLLIEHIGELLDEGFTNLYGLAESVKENDAFAITHNNQEIFPHLVNSEIENERIAFDLVYTDEESDEILLIRKCEIIARIYEEVDYR
jgi:hypothetical protein